MSWTPSNKSTPAMAQGHPQRRRPLRYRVTRSLQLLHLPTHRFPARSVSTPTAAGPPRQTPCGQPPICFNLNGVTPLAVTRTLAYPPPTSSIQPNYTHPAPNGRTTHLDIHEPTSAALAQRIPNTSPAAPSALPYPSQYPHQLACHAHYPATSSPV